MRQILTDMKKIYRDLYNSDGVKREKHSNGYMPRVIKEEHLRFLDAFMTFVLESDLLSDITKRYISSYGLSVADMVTEWNNDENNPPIETRSAINKVNYDIKKLTKYFPDDKMLENVARRVPEYHDYVLAEYEEQLFNAATEYLKPDPMVRNMVLKIPKSRSKNTLSNEKWQELLVIIAPYTKDFMRNLEENMDPDMIGYFNYLVRSPLTKDKDIKRFRELEKLLTYDSDTKIGRPAKVKENYHKKDYSEFVAEDDIILEYGD